MAQIPCPHCNGSGSIAGPVTNREALDIARATLPKLAELPGFHVSVEPLYFREEAGDLPTIEHRVIVRDNIGVVVLSLASDADVAKLPASIPGYVAPAPELASDQGTPPSSQG